MREKIERVTNYFGIIRFLVVFSALLLIWGIVVYVFTNFHFPRYEVCMILVMPIVASIFIPFSLFGIAFIHPMFIMINKDKMKLFFIIGKPTEYKYDDIENVKMNYKSGLSYYPIYLKLKKEEDPKSIDGIGNNIQLVIVKYSKMNSIPTEKYGYWTSSLKED